MKKERQKMLLSLISKYEISTQEELTQRLAQAGFVTTQATISRDMKELGIDKINSSYARVGANDKGSKYLKILSESVVSVDHAQNLVVVKTYSGMGAAAGAALDALSMKTVVGCIAGDVTVLLVTRTPSEAQELCGALTEYHIG